MVVDAVIRKTYGWNKKEDEISNTQLLTMTLLKKGNLSRSLSTLITHKLLVIKTDNSIRFNKDYDQWLPFKRVIKTDNKKTVIKTETKVIRNDNKVLSELRGTKDNKDTIQKTVSARLNEFIGLFEPINISFRRIYGNKSQRAALQRIIDLKGEEWTEKLLRALPTILPKKGAPRISTPYQLEMRLGDLQQFLQQEKNNGFKIERIEV